MNKQIIETEAHNLFEFLRSIVVEEQNREKLINHNTVKFNRSIVKGSTQFFIFIIVLSLFVQLLSQVSYNFTENSIGILIVILIFFLLGASLVSILIPLLVGVDVFYKESKESMHNLLKRIEKDNIFLQKSAKKISKFIGINIQTLESVKTDLKLEIDIIQSKEKILDSLAPLLAIL